MEVFLLVLVTAVALRDGLALTTDYFFSSTELKWNEAEDYCDAQNGHLIMLNSQNKWDEYNDAIGSLDKCSTFYWTALILDTYGCETRRWSNTRSYSGWSYSEWGIWRGSTEPNDCPDDECVVVTCNGMKTRDCRDSYIAMCKKDDPTTAQTTQSVKVTSEVRTTTQTTTTARATADISTNTPKVTTVAPTANNDINIIGVNNSCNNCCVKTDSSKQLNNEELQSAIKELKSQLAVNKTNLSANRRKLISVYDSRSSSITMGGVAIAKLTVVFSLIVVPDMVSLVRFLYRWF